MAHVFDPDIVHECSLASLGKPKPMMFDAFADFYTRLAADYEGAQAEVGALTAFLKPKQ